MAQDSYVQVAPDSTGKKIRNIQASILQPDGSVAIVQMQVVSLVDENGNPARFASDQDIQLQLLDETRAMRMGIQMLVDWLNPVASTIRPLPFTSGSKTGAVVGQTVEENELIEIARDIRMDDDT